MATFDPVEQRLCVRVVYDGAAGSGKTTNLRQLATLFATQRKTEVHTPAEIAGRTLYFDWMEIPAGVVCGIPLLCQIISVPGQVELTDRRLHLLRTADVLVYVCDSSAGAVPRGARGLSLLRALERERAESIPLVVQANKQDQPDSFDASRLQATLGTPDVPCLEAIATDGIGVVDTFVTAIRTFSRSIESRAAAGELRVPIRAAERREAALESVAALRLEPERAAELFLEEASAIYQLEADAADAAPPRPERRRVGVPPLPRPDVPTGFIWPAHTGRATLGALEAAGALTGEACGSAEAARYHAAGFVLETHARLRFDGADAARHALVRAARERTQLGELLVPDTVLVAQPTGDDTYWLWTVRREAPTLRESLRGADAQRATWLADAFGAALADAVVVELRHELSLELGVDTMALAEERLRYVGEVGRPRADPNIGARVSAAIAEIRGPAERAAAADAFHRALRQRIGHDDPAGPKLRALLERGV